MVNKMIALILGGGAGTRLAPLTNKRSKPAVPIGGKYRLIDIPISNCLNSGLRRMFVLTQFNSASLNKHIKNTYYFDHFSKGFVDILAAEQTPTSSDWFQGTADAVRQSMHHLKNQEFDYILILSGDQLYQMDLEDFGKFHVEQEAELTIATIPVVAKDATGFGIMKVNKNNQIESFIEKPDSKILPNWESPVASENKKEGKVYLASMGIYIFNRSLLETLFEKNPDSVDFGKEIIPYAIKSGIKVSSYNYSGYWEDIGTIRSFFEANLALTDKLPAFNMFDNKSIIYTRPRLLAPTKIFGTVFRQAVVAEGSIIHAKSIERTIVGIRSRIGENTVISNTIIMGNDYYETLGEVVKATKKKPAMGVGENCYIENAILDKNCMIGNNVTIRGHEELEDKETDTYCIREGIVVIKKRAVIPSGTRIG